MSQICNKCNIQKLYQCFDKTENYLRKTCKACRNKQKYEKNKNDIDININEKVCNTCDEMKSINNYNKRCCEKDGYNKNCKDCAKNIRLLQKQKKNDIILPIVTFKKCCIKCNIEKDNVDFKINLKASDNYANICNNCTRKSTWSKDKQKESERKYIENNKEKIREKWKRQGKKINRRVRDSLNHRISEALFQSKLTKNNKTNQYIGCDIPFLKKWFDYQFLDNMSWDNYGEWEIDHVVPCCKHDFNKYEDIIKCFHWTNLQPLWKEDNLQKSGKYDIELEQLHNKKVKDFLKFTSRPK